MGGPGWGRSTGAVVERGGSALGVQQHGRQRHAGVVAGVGGGTRRSYCPHRWWSSGCWQRWGGLTGRTAAEGAAEWGSDVAEEEER